jgi:hypothetical protein
VIATCEVIDTMPVLDQAKVTDVPGGAVRVDIPFIVNVMPGAARSRGDVSNGAEASC